MLQKNGFSLFECLLYTALLGLLAALLFRHTTFLLLTTKQQVAYLQKTAKQHLVLDEFAQDFSRAQSCTLTPTGCELHMHLQLVHWFNKNGSVFRTSKQHGALRGQTKEQCYQTAFSVSQNRQIYRITLKTKKEKLQRSFAWHVGTAL